MSSAPNSPPSAGVFRVWLLGPFDVERDGVFLHTTRWQRRIARLFKLLAVAPHHHRTRDELLGLLWPDATEEAAGANLRLVLHRLRHVLMDGATAGPERPSPIVSEHGWVALNPAYHWEVDLDRFIQRAEAAGDDIAALEEAAALHRGEALEEEAYDDWATPYRERVARLWRQVCLRLAMLHRAQGSLERAVEWLERLLEADPLDEVALRELLITLEALTRETEALRRFRRFEKLLSEELDVPPDAETLAVAARVAEHLRETEATIPSAPGTSTPSMVPVIPSYPLSTGVPLIDRRQELARIAEMMAVAAGDAPRILLVAAEAGVGKTRLLAEAAARARQEGMFTLAGGCYEQEGHLPYAPIHDALLDYVRTQPEVLLETQLNDLFPDLARVVPELRLRIRTPAPEWVGDAEVLRLRLFSAVAQALARIAEGRPLLLLLDDLHWADEGTLQLLHFLLRQTQLRRVLILGAYRLEEVDTGSPLARWLVEFEDDDVLAARTLSLSGLDLEELTELLEERLRGPCSGALSRALYDRSAGNPFFALQMLRLLQQEGRLERVNGRWRLVDASQVELYGETLLPVKVRKTVARRLSKLSPQERDALAIGAVLGREFPYAAIEALWEGGKNDLFQALEGAVNAYLIGETESGFAFRHPILREVVYDGIPGHRRRRLHRHAGFALQALYDPLDGISNQQHAAQLAWHFLQGQEPGRALGYAQLAGDQALAAFAHQQAEAHYRTALALARQVHDGSAERRALEQLGHVLTELGHYDEASTMLEEAAKGYSAENDLEGQRRVVARIGQVYLKTGELERGIDHVTGALQTLDSPAPSAGLGALHLALAALSFRTGRYRAQLNAANRAIEVAQALDERTLLVQAQLMRAYSLPWLGSTADFRHALEEVVASAEEIGDLPTLARALCALADPYTAMGEFVRAREVLARAMEIAERVADPSRIAFTAYMCGLAAYVRGEWDEAESFFSRSLAIYGELKALSDTMVPLFGLGAVRVRRGDWDEGSAALEQHIRLAQETGDFRWLHSAQILLAERDTLAGSPEDALARLESVTHLPDLSSIARSAILPALAWTYLELGQVDRATMTASEATERAREEDDREALVEALCVQGMVLAREQRAPDAEASFDAALQLLEQTPFPYVRGRVLYAFGHMLAGQGESGEAHIRLQEALDVFRQLGARPYIERTEEALAQLTPSHPHQASSYSRRNRSQAR